MAQHGDPPTKIGTRALGSRGSLVALILLAACAEPRQFDEAAADARHDGQDGTPLGIGADGGVDVEPLPPATKPGDVVWQVNPGFGVEALALDGQGNVVVVGKARPTGLMGEIAIAKYTPSGKQLWQKSFGGPGEQGATAVAVAIDGTIVVTGGFQNDTSFGEMARTAAGGSDAFVAAYSPEGRLKSVFTFGGFGNEEGLAVVVDAPSGDWLVTGHGSSEFMASTFKVTGPFVMRLQPDGTVRWARSAGRNLVATGPDGSAVYVAGSGVKDQVTRHDPMNGDIKWTKLIGQDIHPSAGLVDSAGRLLLTGGFYTNLIKGSELPIKSFGKRDAFFLALDGTSGDPVWTNVILASQGEDSGRAMCLGADGNVFIAGRYFGTSALAFGDPETAEHAFVARHASNGNKVWTRLYREGTSAAAILCGATGGIVAGGEGWLMMVLP